MYSVVFLLQKLSLSDYYLVQVGISAVKSGHLVFAHN